jgi:Fe-S cluster biogenesis protein NfuA
MEKYMLEEKVKSLLENVRPTLQADGGDVEFVSCNEGVVKLKLVGHCGHCPMSQMTLKMGIERYLKDELPEIKSVENVVDLPLAA